MSYESSSFDEDVFLLSSACHIRDHIPKPTRIEESPAIQKHVSLLDDTALLLLTEAKGDVCATTWRLTNQQVEIFYSKNAPTHKSLDPYFMEIQQILTSPLHWCEKEKQLLLLVIHTCIEKFRHRMQKTQKTLKNSQDWTFVSASSKTLSDLRPIWNDKTDAQIIVEFLTMFPQIDLNIEKLRKDPWSLLVYSRTAYHIGNVISIHVYNYLIIFFNFKAFTSF